MRLTLLICLGYVLAAAQTKDTSADVATFRSKVNVVLVPVVVRNGHGSPIGKLTKDDFQIFDRGKKQEISSFSAVERAANSDSGVRDVTRLAEPEGRDSKRTFHVDRGAMGGGSTGSPQQRNLIYLFDDVNVRFADLAQTRQAAFRHFEKGLQAGDRVAIYSFSGNPTLEFTDDAEKLSAAVKKLRWRAMVGRGGMQCPDVSYYMANLVITKKDALALAALTDHTSKCTHVRPEIAENIAMAAANRELIMGAQDTELALRTIRRAIRRLSGMPGQRVIVLASPGFFAETSEAVKASAEVLDLAAKSNVIISSLNVRGVILAEEEQGVAESAGTGRRPERASSPASMWVLYRREGARANGEVMKDFAEGTGGTAFRNNNDLFAGFDRASAAPEYSYVLGFAPTNLREDGSFHRLKVQLAQSKGMMISARRGYYAVKYDPKDRNAAADIDDALFSRDEVVEIPIVLQTGYSLSNIDGAAKVQAVIRIDVSSLHFKKTEGREDQLLRVVAALFDQDGGYIAGSSELVKLKLLEGRKDQHPAVTLRWEFDAGKGKYFVRIVVRESQGKAMTTVSRGVTIP